MINSEVKEDKELIDDAMDQTMEAYSAVNNQLIKKQSDDTPVELLDNVELLEIDKAEEDERSIKGNESVEVHQFDKPKIEKKDGKEKMKSYFDFY